MRCRPPARPSPPQSLTASDITSQSVRLQWAVKEEDKATHCVVQRSLGSKTDDRWTVVYKGDAQLTCVFELVCVVAV